jgi:hypothetical protein
MSSAAGDQPHARLAPDFGRSMAEGRALSEEMIVAVSADERARGQLHPEAQRAAHAGFRQHGCLMLRGVFPPPVIGAMYQDYLSRYGALDSRQMLELAAKPPPNPFIARGEARYQITPRMNGAIGAPEVFANGLLRQLLALLLGGDMQLNSFTLVVSHPGAPLQPVHRDHAHLFAEPGIGPSLPAYAVNVVVPLIDIDLQTGPTGVWPGSHQWPLDIRPPPETVTAHAMQRGDCMLVDYRTLHTGLPNKSAGPRPIVYMVYARSWFFDDVNHFGTNPLDLPLEEQRKLPESTRPLLTRALSQAIRGQATGAERVGHPRPGARISDDPASWGKVGRNDPCPCGSGRKFKQCHGRAD